MMLLMLIEPARQHLDAIDHLGDLLGEFVAVATLPAEIVAPVRPPSHLGIRVAGPANVCSISFPASERR
jgi:hypothetical protein